MKIRPRSFSLTSSLEEHVKNRFVNKSKRKRISWKFWKVSKSKIECSPKITTNESEVFKIGYGILPTNNLDFYCSTFDDLYLDCQMTNFTREIDLR